MPEKQKNRRLEELSALVYGASALLSGLALASYSPFDPSLNASAPLGGGVHNLIGLAGSYTSDLLLQLFGLTAFLLPALLGVLCWRRAAGRPAESLGVQLTGSAFLVFSLTTALALPARFAYGWRWHGAILPGGLTGDLLSTQCLELLNLTGTLVALAVLFVVSLYLLTAFSFATAQGWFGWVGRLRARWTLWREARAAKKAQARLEKMRAKRRAVDEQEPATAEGQAGEGSDSAPIVTPPAARRKAVPEPGDDDEAPWDESMDDVPVHVVPEVAAQARRAPSPLPKPPGQYKLPPAHLLREPDPAEAVDETELKRLATVLKAKCDEFGVSGAVTQINPGPVVTTYEFKPEAGIKYSRVTNLVDDLCLALQAESILIERIPGKSTVGIEVPNPRRVTIYLREIIESADFVAPGSRLTMAVGKDINGRIRVVDLAAMPHLLIAGSTGSGKSVALNTFITSLLYKFTPDQVRMIMVDPKRLELGLYDGVPHLMTPIITEAKLAAYALKNAVKEMERRLKLLAARGVRNIEQYNKQFEQPATLSLFEENSDERALPFIVIVIDELADLMMIDSRNVEESITRLAQMARAVGIHLILATQRPSVDVLTGLIKANLPSRMSFRVATKVDSRTILDCNGAEALLGKGDMLYLPPGSARLVRLHGAFVTEKEITEVVNFWKAQSKPEYEAHFLESPDPEDGGEDGEGSGPASDDPMYEEAVRVIVEMGKASTSILQRRLRLGYGRAARLLDMMQADGIIGPPDGSKPREVLKRPDWFAEVDNSLR